MVNPAMASTMASNSAFSKRERCPVATSPIGAEWLLCSSRQVPHGSATLTVLPPTNCMLVRMSPRAMPSKKAPASVILNVESKPATRN